MTINNKQLVRLTSISDTCPFKACDGSGFIHVLDEELKQQQRDDMTKRKAAGLPYRVYDPYEYTVKCDCYAQLQADKAMKGIGIPKEFKDLRVASFDTSLYDEGEKRTAAITAKNAVGRFVKNFDRVHDDFESKGIYFWSETKGSGKTRLAASLANALVKSHVEKGKGIKVRYAVVVELLEGIKATFDKSSTITTSEYIREAIEADVLILDDIGIEGASKFVNEKLYQILDARMTAKRVTVFTSNMPIEALEDKYEGDNGRIASRVHKMAFPLHMPEQKVRQQLAEEQNKRLADFLMGE